MVIEFPSYRTQGVSCSVRCDFMPRNYQRYTIRCLYYEMFVILASRGSRFNACSKACRNMSTDWSSLLSFVMPGGPSLESHSLPLVIFIQVTSGNV